MFLKLLIVSALTYNTGHAAVKQSDVTFLFFNKKDPADYTLLVLGQYDDVYINPNIPFKFILHGWRDTGDSPWIIDLVKQYFKKSNYNIISVDWSKQAAELYPLPVYDLPDVSKCIGDLMNDLNIVKGVAFKLYEVIGISLGGQLGGFVGKYMSTTYKVKIGRITGLDPAGPWFTGCTEDKRLNKCDANFVDCIHTNGGFIGTSDLCGHVDFYPNGKPIIQPGCTDPICSHGLSVLLFGESINSDKFVATQCESYTNYTNGNCAGNSKAIMGEDVNILSQGTYYLQTNANPPYAQG